MAASIDLPNVIKSARKERGLSQLEIGHALGVSAQTVSFWESGKSAPRGTTRLRSLAKILGLRPEELGVEPYPWEEPGKRGSDLIDEDLRVIRSTPSRDVVTTSTFSPASANVEEPEIGTSITPAELDIQLQQDLEAAKKRWEERVRLIQEEHERRKQLGMRYRRPEETAQLLSRLLPEDKAHFVMQAIDLRGATYRYTYFSTRTLAMVIQTGNVSTDRESQIASSTGRMALYRLALMQRRFDDVACEKYNYVLFLEGTYVPKVLMREAEVFGINIVPSNSLASIADRIVEIDSIPTPSEVISGHNRPDNHPMKHDDFSEF